MTRITKTFTASENWTIPSNAVNIQYIIRGARGGNSPDAGDYSGNWSDLCYGMGDRYGGQGQYLFGTLADSYAGQSINFTQGLRGVDNPPSAGASSDAGSLGGAGVHNGGPGGIKPTNTSGALTCSAGGGAGGGGSSAFKTAEGTIMIEAGGGGGSGGDGRDFAGGTSVGVYNSPGVVSHYQGMGIAPASVTQNPSCDSNIQSGWFTRTGSSTSNPTSGIRTLVVKWQGTTLYEGPEPSYLSTYGEIYVENNNKGYRCSPSTYRGSAYGWCNTDACGTCAAPNGDECNSFDVYIYRIPVVNYTGTFTAKDVSYVSNITTTNNGSNGGTGGQGSSSGNAGSGGGGGGNPGGNGGSQNIAGNQIPGYPGIGGSGYYDTGLVASCSAYIIGYENWATQTFVDDGWGEISWEESPAPSATLTSSSTAINRGQSITLTWSSSGGTSYTMTGVANPGANGSVTVTPPTGTNVYTFTATNEAGTTTSTVTVVVTLLAPTASLTSDDSDNVIISGNVQSGDPVTLTWSGTGEDITNYSMTGVNNPGASGAVVVSPNTTTTYTYALQNATGSASASQTITVYQRPVVTLTAPTSNISPGQGLALTWTTTGDASSVSWVNGSPVPSSNALNDTELVYPGGSTQYCIIATGNGGVSETVCFNVNVIPIDSSVTDYDTTFNDDGTAYIPPWAIDITVDAAGASGGKGGTDAGGSGGGGGAGRRGFFTFPDYTERTFTLRPGNQGVNGFGCVANSGVGAGGSSSVAAGGSGGRSGPSGCSGGGAGGGGATGVFDSLKNGYVAIAGGGGGGGGASWEASATSGSSAGPWSGFMSAAGAGGTGTSCPTDGGGGGGGGGGAGGGGGGAEGYDKNYGGRGGSGGSSRYDNSYTNYSSATGSTHFGDGFVRVRYDVGSPEITSFTANPSPIIRGQAVTLSWTSTFSITGSINNGVGAIAVPNGSTTVFPQDDITYQLTVVGPGGINTATDTVSIVVYIPPVLNLTLNSASIIFGAGTTISWNVTGDGDALYWTAGGLTNTNLDSSSAISPAVSTTYSGYVTGLGGTSGVSSATLIVYYPPTLNVDHPAVLDYGQQAVITYDGQYANTSVTLSATYNYDFVPDVTDPIVNLNTAASAEFGSDSDYSGTYNTNIVYNDRGPLSVTYTITANGNGGSDSKTFTIPINVDRTPDNINIEESDGLFKDQDPIITPETDVLSEMYLIDDIEMQVEVKSTSPILVDVNKSETWTKVRQVGTNPPVQGNSVGGNSLPSEPGTYRIKASSLPSEPPLIVERTNLTAIDYAKLITCVSVIDETGGSYYNNQGNLNNVWQQSPAIIGQGYDSRGFRTAFPYRTFYILDPGGGGSIDVPTNYPGDANAYGPITVNRDNGNNSARSDWFDICNFQNLPYGTIVSIWIDISGSMTLDTVQASYDYFLQRCAAAGIEIVLSLSASGERYIEEHIQYLPPSANFTAVDQNGNTSNIQVIAGDPVTLSWTVFGDVNNMRVTPNVQNTTSNFANYVKSITVYPASDTEYQLVVNGPAGSTVRSISIDVLVPPTIIISSSQGPSIITGNCTNLSWNVFGDGNSVSWTQGSITNNNVNSNETVCPNDTTTYCAVASGPGGVSPETCITITVYQIPTASIESPAVVNYNDNFAVEYQTQYANTSITIVPTYTYLDGSVVTGTTINRTPATSAEISGGTSTIANGTGVPITVPYNNFGPSQIDFVITASGNGGTATDTARTLINIDQTPDNFTIDESDDKLKNEAPVFTPETDILSEMYYIDDIDIPVEVKADYPIKVDINKNDDWKDVRRI